MSEDEKIKLWNKMGLSPEYMARELEIPLERVQRVLGLKIAVAAKKHLTVPSDKRIRRYLTPEEILALRPGQLEKKKSHRG